MINRREATVGGASDNCLKLDRLHEPCADREDKTHVRMHARRR